MKIICFTYNEIKTAVNKLYNVNSKTKKSFKRY